MTLGGPDVWIKRDDLTGLAIGGNKTRMLDFWVAEARNAGADMLITGAFLQSNHSRQVAAAANRFGMKAVLVLFGKLDNEIQGNLLLDAVLGAEIRHMPDGDFSNIHEHLAIAEREYRAKGHRPHVIHGLAAAGITGAIAYVGCLLETLSQFEETEIMPDCIITPSGSGATHAGLALGVRALGLPIEVFGISVRRSAGEIRPSVAAIANQAAEILGLETRLAPEDILVDDQSVGEGYGIPTEECMEAIRMAARTEGILLDPTYSSKVMGGMMRLIQQKKFSADQKVLFLHSGGTPILFARHRLFASEARIAPL